MKKRVAYQGIKGSFSSMAASAMLGADFEALTTSRFRDIFEHVTSASADIGIIPIENALAGSVHENYDLLAEFNCSIIAEYYCPVQLHLMATGLLAGGVNELRQINKLLTVPDYPLIPLTIPMQKPARAISANCSCQSKDGH